MAEGISVLEAEVPSAGPAPWYGMVLSLSRPWQLHSVRRLMAKQQHFVLAQKIHMGRNKEGLMGLRSGKQSMPQSRGLLLWLLFSLTQGQSIAESDEGGILFSQAKFSCGTGSHEMSEAQS